MLSNDNDHINKFLDSSVINSKQINFESEGTIELLYGEITINTLNLSKNQCVACPAIWCYQGSSNTKHTCSIKFCSFRNYVGLVSTLAISTTFASCTNSNFIENTASYYGLIQSFREMIVEGCTILDNNANPVFFASTGRKISIINCTCQEVTKGGSGDISETHLSQTQFINAVLPTFVNELCQVGLDRVGTLTPILPGGEEEGTCSCPRRNYGTCIQCPFINPQNLYQTLEYTFLITFLPYA